MRRKGTEQGSCGSIVPLAVVTVLIAALLLLLMVQTTLRLERSIQDQAGADATALAGANIEAVVLDANAVFNLTNLALHGGEAFVLGTSLLFGVPLAVSIVFTPEGLGIISTGLQVSNQILEANRKLMELRNEMNLKFSPFLTMGGVLLLPLLGGEHSSLSIPYPLLPNNEEKPYLTPEDCETVVSSESNPLFLSSTPGAQPTRAALEIQAKGTNPAVLMGMIKELFAQFLGGPPDEGNENDKIQEILKLEEAVDEKVKEVLNNLSGFEPGSYFSLPEFNEYSCSTVASYGAEVTTRFDNGKALVKGCAQMVVDKIKDFENNYPSSLQSWQRDLQKILAPLSQVGGDPNTLLQEGGKDPTLALEKLRSTLDTFQGIASCIANDCSGCLQTLCNEAPSRLQYWLKTAYPEIRDQFFATIKGYSDGIVNGALGKFQNLVEVKKQNIAKGQSVQVRTQTWLEKIWAQLWPWSILSNIPCEAMVTVGSQGEVFPMPTILHPAFFSKQIVGSVRFPFSRPWELRISQAQPVPPAEIQPGKPILKPGFSTRLTEAEFPRRILPADFLKDLSRGLTYH